MFSFIVFGYGLVIGATSCCCRRFALNFTIFSLDLLWICKASFSALRLDQQGHKLKFVWSKKKRNFCSAIMVHYGNDCISFSCNFPVYSKLLLLRQQRHQALYAKWPVTSVSSKHAPVTGCWEKWMLPPDINKMDSFYMKRRHYYFKYFKRGGIHLKRLNLLNFVKEWAHIKKIFKPVTREITRHIKNVPSCDNVALFSFPSSIKI